jgi:DtxR family Mn-dependent transcriptional regulator
MLTQAEENYLKAILRLENSDSKNVSTTLIAKRLQTKASSVTDMLKKLSDKGFVNYQKYKGVTLSEKGKKTSADIVRKHRLWEVFLVEKLNYSWDEVHDIAEQLEHIKSDSLTDRLDAFLGHPAYDPHGDPIPGKDGLITPVKTELLFSIPENSSCIVKGVIDSSNDFLKFLNSLKIGLGETIKVVSKESFDRSMQVIYGDRIVVLSEKVSKNLIVKKI